MSPFFFTWTSQDSATPISIRGGKGAHFHADEGEWLDFSSLVWQMNAGYGCEDITNAIKAQVDELCFSPPSGVFPAKTELAERLLGLAPDGFSKVFFTLGGSEATENALKIARLYTGHHKIIARYRSYHGATLGAVSATGDWRRAAVEPGLPGVKHVLDLDGDDFDSTVIPRTLELERNVGAVLLETIVGKNGAMIPTQDYYRKVQSACRKEGSLLILDEVLVGFGRTGKMLALDHYPDLSPDMITLGKGLTAGYGALGAVLVHERIAEHFDENMLACGLTHYAHPIGVASALAALNFYEKNKLADRSAELGKIVQKALSEMRDAMPKKILAARNIGLFGVVQVPAEILDRVQEHLRKMRLHTMYNSDEQLIFISPPLTIDEDDLRGGLQTLRDAITRA